MALIKTTKKSHGPTIYTLELTEAEAWEVLEALEAFKTGESDPIQEGLARVLPPASRPLDDVLAEIDAEEAAADVASDVDPDDGP